MNNLYPVFLKMEGRPVLVVGGGSVAEQKLKTLLDVSADITLIAPSLTETVERLVLDNNVRLHRRSYRMGDAEGFILVIGATDDRSVQGEIYQDAVSKGIPVNIVDVPELCTFYLSSVFQKGDLKIAVSTNGKSPTLGKLIRDKLRAEFSDGFPALLETLGDLRPHVLSSFVDYEKRKEVFENIVRTELSRMDSGERHDNAGTAASTRGSVTLVGAGPGDPELISVKGLRCVESADVIVYDSLANRALVDKAPVSAEKIYAGKRAGAHCIAQEVINDLLISKAKEGKNVVRLKGGDPFIFGRGGEEMEALRDAGINIEVVPGITAGIGVPTSLGIPLTHRHISSSVVFLTGHEDPKKVEERIDWSSVSTHDTVVIYMGVKRIDEIVHRIAGHGISLTTPVAVIFAGTLPEEEIVVGTLETIGEQMKLAPFNLPGLIIVGDVVRFHTGTKVSSSARTFAEAE